jgi:murein DD-endopeptidase MepM/ murein hydrolase activator NlpD
VLFVTALLELGLAAVLCLLWGSGFVVVSALLGGVIDDERLRLALALGPTLVVPLCLLVRWRRRISAPVSFVALASAIVAIGLSLGFADDVGRALRRHGDWFLGERTGLVARGVRASLRVVAARLERFATPPELAPTLLPPEPEPFGPWRPGEEPKPVAPMLAWFHPLLGADRAMPESESRRFGAVRPQPRPVECELGHCGVDLGHSEGQGVVAIFDGVVERIELDENKGGRAGRYVRIGHKDGKVVSRYIHLDSVRSDLKVGMLVRGGELIGRVGRTGIEHSGPHLHFGLSLRPEGRHGTPERYIDPEPLLRTWTLLQTAREPLVAARASAARPVEALAVAGEGEVAER